jgi:hypothetical protein
MDCDVVTISVQGDAGDRPKRLLDALIEGGKLRRFCDAIVERRDLWTTLCWLEDDMLQFEASNRSSCATDGWKIAVGHCSELEDVPAYCGWGELQAWLLYDDGSRVWAVTIRPAEYRQLEDVPDVLVWDAAEFDERCDAAVAMAVPFADDSGMRLNKAMRELRELESLLA